MRELGLADELERRDTASSSHYIFAADGSVVAFFGPKFFHEATGGADDESQQQYERTYFNVHTPRQVLRRLLLDQLTASRVVWSHKLVAIEQEPSAVRLRFANGCVQRARLLVGADGIYSTVRAHLRPNEPLNYLGVLVVLGICASEEFVLLRRRVVQMVDGATRIFVMPFTERGAYASHDSVMWQLSFACDEQSARVMASSARLLKDEALLRCGLWHEPIPSLIRNTPTNAICGTPGLEKQEEF